MMERRANTMILRISLLVCMVVGRGNARECVEISQKTAFHAAAVVFRGVVEKLEHTAEIEVTDAITGKRVMRHPDVHDDTIATFRVTATWKGFVTPTMKIHSVFGGRYQFQEGKEYVVYAADSLNQDWDKLRQLNEGLHVYTIGDCPLRLLTDVARESLLLGKGHAPRKTPN